MVTNRLAVCCTTFFLFATCQAPFLTTFGFNFDQKKRKAKMRRWRGVVTGSRWPGALTSPARGHSALITLPLPAAKPLSALPVAAGRQSIFFIASTTITRQRTPQRLAHMRCTFHTTSDGSTRVPLSSVFIYIFLFYLYFYSFLFYFITPSCFVFRTFSRHVIVLFLCLWRQSHSSSFRTTQSLQHIMEASQHTADPFYKVRTGPHYGFLQS